MKTAYEILTSTKKFHISLGLERVKKVLNLLDNPQEKYECFHIAGTNGKGSTSKIINDILIENFKNTDIKTGLFTSPHLFSYTERIKINNKDINTETFNELVNFVDELAVKNDIELTEFEIITVTAFYYFYLEKVKYVVLETGLGGLLDATNVILKPLVCIITTIDFDHTERLGKTIEEIASQKAGIIKENSNVVISPKNLGYNRILKTVKDKNAALISIPKVKILRENNINYACIIDKNRTKKYEFNLLGSHQADNLALALSAIKISNLLISEETIKNALKNVHWLFRIEYKKDKNLIIDGAHNPSGIMTLRRFLDENFKEEKKCFIFGCLKNKDYKKMLKILLTPEDKFYFFEFNYPNALKFDELSEEYKNKAIKLTDINEVKKIIDENSDLKIVCGSFYMLGKIFSS